MSLAVAAPAQAQRCWNQTLIEAAQVKEFDIMLMVATLRCQARGIDMSSSYNSFVIKHRPALKGVGQEIVRDFTQAVGGKEAAKAYDRMGVVMANKYGNGVAGLECADYQAMITEAGAATSNRAQLVALAQRAGLDPALPVKRCVPAPVVAMSTTPAPAAAAAPAPVGPPAVSVAPKGPSATQ